MSKSLQKAFPDFTELKELFGPPPVLSSEDPSAYEAMWERIIQSIKPRDFIEHLLAKDLTDVTWEMKRYSRHKALVVEREYLEQREIEEAEEEEAEPLDQATNESEQTDHTAVQSQQVEQGQQGEQNDAPTTLYERSVELDEAVCSLIPDVGELSASVIRELECAEAFESKFNYYERIDRLQSVAIARREDLLKQLDDYRQGVVRQVSDNIIEGGASKSQQEAPPIAGPGDGGQ